MRSDIAISVRNLTKTYRIFGHPGDRIKQAVTLGRLKFHKEFTALKDVSFEIKRGETIGIIGRNGSGKSTLLQLICGILKPTSGSVQVDGRISALLELGAGFNPEFTGRENVYFQCSLMDIRKEEVDNRFDDIAAFADIGEFMDQPVRTYSSGMFIRLAFAAAIHSDPEIMVVDAALAVGDARFQQKCYRYFTNARQRGVTLLLVTHDMQMIRATCDKAIYIEKGELKTIGDPETTSEYYLNNTFTSPQGIQEENTGKWHRPTEPADPKGQIISLQLQCRGSGHQHVKTGDQLSINLSAMVTDEVSNPELVIQIRDKRGYALFGMRTQPENLQKSIEETQTIISASFSLIANLGSDEYGITVGLNDRHGGTLATVLDKVVGAVSFTVDSSNRNFHGPVDLQGQWKTPEN